MFDFLSDLASSLFEFAVGGVAGGVGTAVYLERKNSQREERFFKDINVLQCEIEKVGAKKDKRIEEIKRHYEEELKKNTISDKTKVFVDALSELKS